MIGLGHPNDHMSLFQDHVIHVLFGEVAHKFIIHKHLGGLLQMCYVLATLHDHMLK